MRILNSIMICLLGLTLVISGCSPQSKVVPAKSAGKALPQTSPHEEVRTKLKHFMSEGDLLQAHKTLRNARRKGVQEKPLLDLYQELGDRLLAEAKKEETASRFANAGRFYRLSLDLFPEQDQQLQLELSMHSKEISERLEECADRLMKSGLAVYRAGELEDAINIWKRIREFHPEHAPSKVAISTAEKQLESLEKLAPEKVM